MQIRDRLRALGPIFFAGVCAVLCGCQTMVPVRTDKEMIVSRPPSNLTITMLSKAKDVRSAGVDQVGRHTISIFMIPGPTVTTENEHLDDAIANRVREGLVSSGFSVVPVDKIDQANGPVMVVQIDQLRNYLFSWFYPVGLVFGDMTLSVHIVTPDGKELWQEKTKGHGGTMPSLFYMSGFETRVQSDLTANVNQIIEIASSPEFTDALRKAEVSTHD